MAFPETSRFWSALRIPVARNLVEVGTNFYLDSIGSGSGPELKYAGTAVVVGQFGAWAPISVEQTTTGYEVAWKMACADQYTVWNTDISDNFATSTTGVGVGNEFYAGISRDQFPSRPEQR